MTPVLGILGTVFQWLGYTIYNASAPVAVDGQTVPLQSAIDGSLLVNVVGVGGAGGSASLPVGSTDTVGGAVPVTPNAVTWNRSASAVQNNYGLPIDTTNWPHLVGWLSGVAPMVTAPAGWKILNPVTGVLTAAANRSVASRISWTPVRRQASVIDGADRPATSSTEIAIRDSARPTAGLLS